MDLSLKFEFKRVIVYKNYCGDLELAKFIEKLQHLETFISYRSSSSSAEVNEALMKYCPKLRVYGDYCDKHNENLKLLWFFRSVWAHGQGRFNNKIGQCTQSKKHTSDSSTKKSTSRIDHLSKWYDKFEDFSIKLLSNVKKTDRLDKVKIVMDVTQAVEFKALKNIDQIIKIIIDKNSDPHSMRHILTGFNEFLQIVQLN